LGANGVKNSFEKWRKTGAFEFFMPTVTTITANLIKISDIDLDIHFDPSFTGPLKAAWFFLSFFQAPIVLLPVRSGRARV